MISPVGRGILPQRPPFVAHADLVIVPASRDRVFSGRNCHVSEARSCYQALRMLEECISILFKELVDGEMYKSNNICFLIDDCETKAATDEQAGLEQRPKLRG